MAPSPSNDYIACFSDQGWLDVFDRNFEDHVSFHYSTIIYRLLVRIQRLILQQMIVLSLMLQLV